jgi:hypothetical protein
MILMISIIYFKAKRDLEINLENKKLYKGIIKHCKLLFVIKLLFNMYFKINLNNLKYSNNNSFLIFIRAIQLYL